MSRTQSARSERSRTRRSCAANAARTAGSASAVIPAATSDPPAETRARQPAELWIAHAEESRPRVVLLQALADLCE